MTKRMLLVIVLLCGCSPISYARQSAYSRESSYEVPEDYTKVLISLPRENGRSTVADPSVQQQIKELNAKMALVIRQLDEIQKTQAVELTGKVSY